MLQALAQNAYHCAAAGRPPRRLQAAHANLEAFRQGQLSRRHPLRGRPRQRRPRRELLRGRVRLRRLPRLPGARFKRELGARRPDLGVQGRAHWHPARHVRRGQALQGPRILAPARHGPEGADAAVHPFDLPSDPAPDLQHGAPALVAARGRNCRRAPVLAPGELQVLLLQAADHQPHLRRRVVRPRHHLAHQEGRGHAPGRQLSGPRRAAPGLAALQAPPRHVHESRPPAPGGARGRAVHLRSFAVQKHGPLGAGHAAQAHAHEARRPRRHRAPRSRACDCFCFYSFSSDNAVCSLVRVEPFRECCD